jgi:hypothetical protein
VNEQEQPICRVGDGIKLILLKNAEQPRINRAGSSASRPGPRRAQGRRSRLTAELLHVGATNQHGFKNHQLTSLERRKDWLKNLIGVEIPAATYQAFLAANPARNSRDRALENIARINIDARCRSTVSATPFRNPHDEIMPWE